MRTLLIQPPLFNPYNVYLSIPSLTGAMRQAGFNVDQVDLNIHAWCELLSNTNLVAGKQFLDEQIVFLKNKSSATQSEKRFLSVYEKIHLKANYIVKKTNQLFGDYPNVLSSKSSNTILTIYYAVMLSIAKYYPERISLSNGGFSYQGLFNPHSSDELIKAAHSHKGMLNNFFDTWIAKNATDNVYDLIGLSCPYESNLIPAIQLAFKLKKVNNKSCIVIGGAAINGKFRDIKETRLFDIIDIVVFDDGEIPLLKMAEEIKNKNYDFSNIPNLLYKKNQNQICKTSTDKVYFFDSKSIPDYNGLNLNKYAVKISKSNDYKLYLPIRSVHGCYWKKCTFCDTCLPYVQNFKQRKAIDIVNEIASLKQKLNIKYFHFVDEALPPKLIKEIAGLLIEKNIEVEWMTNIRFDNFYTDEICKLLYKAGCRRICGGLESLNNRILRLMNKGITEESFYQVLENLHNNNILTCIYLIAGFPTQTLNEILFDADKVRLLIKNKKIENGNWHRFIISKSSIIFKNPNKYDIKTIYENRKLDLCDYVARWENISGMCNIEMDNVTRFLTYLMDQWRKNTMLDIAVNVNLYNEFIKFLNQSEILKTVNRDFNSYEETFEEFRIREETFLSQ